MYIKKDDKGNYGLLFSKDEWDTFRQVLGYSNLMAGVITKQLEEIKERTAEMHKVALKAATSRREDRSEFEVKLASLLYQIWRHSDGTD